MGSGQVSGPVLFLHGFWGQATDWHFLSQSSASEFKLPYQALEYTRIPELGPQNFLSDWGQSFLQWKKEHYGPQKIKAVGYSQGGRLLLQALQVAPNEFEKLVLISSHPGLQSFSEKEQRLESDRHWAKKFRNLAWEQLKSDWNAQGVFKNGKGEPIRLEKNFDRETLALCFENWSLAHQQDFRKTINENLDKISIILGVEDSKYVQLYQDFLADLQALKMEKGAAHRVPFDQPLQLVETLNSIF